MTGDSRVTRISKLLSALQAQHERGRGEVRLIELSTATSIPLTTTSRLINEMCHHRIVERVSGGYRLGTWLFELGECALQADGLRDVALPYLTDLCRSTNSATHLGILHAGEVLYIAKITSAEYYWIPTKVGGRAPAKHTALGIALLANGCAFAAQSFANVNPDSEVIAPPEPDKLRQVLAEVRHRGYAIDRGATVKDMGCVAMPVRVHGEAVAAVSCSIALDRFRPELLTPALHSITEAIGRGLHAATTRAIGGPTRSLLVR
jgi:DNA-binding IclR family transcriptional regulator